MAKIVREITADVARKNSFQAIVAKQNDSDSRFLKVTLCNEGKKIPVEASACVLFSAERADREAKAFAGAVNDDGTVTVPLTGWMLALDDLVRCEVSVIDAEGRKLTSTSFAIEVERASYTGDDVTEDEHYDPLVILLGEVAAAKESCDTAAKGANAAAGNASAAASEARLGASAANQAAASASREASAAEEAANHANSKAELANTAATKAGNAASAANTAAQSANTAASAANLAAKEAREAAERADSFVIAGEDGTLHLGNLRVAGGNLILDITQLQGG